jgi:serine/threonine protein kinase
MPELQIESVHAVSRSFGRRFGIRPPRSGETLSLLPQLDAGGFGAVHPVSSRAGREGGPALMAKLFHPNPATEAHVSDLISRLHRALERLPDGAWPERLLALPYAIAQVRFEGESRLMALMLDLRSRGYRSYSFDEAQAAEYLQRSDLDRLEFAYSFACGAQLLESISFVHADINLKNLLFNDETGDVQIIDFDSGALQERGDERPIAVGRAMEYDFVPPEVKCGPLDPEPADASLYTLEANRWSIGTMVGTLLFGVMPLFFLSEFSKSAIDAYAAQGRRWPDVDTSSEIFNAANQESYESWGPWFEAAPREARDRLADLFAAGSDGPRRPTASAWIEALEVARKPPSFAFLRAEPDVLVEGTEVLISWRVEGAEEVESKLFGSLESEGNETFVVGQATRFELKASNRYGTVTAATNPVRVVPVPRMERVPIPTFPDLRLQVRVPAAIPSPPAPLPPPAQLTPAAAFPPLLPTGLGTLPPVAPLSPPLPSFAHLFSGLKKD